MVLSRAYKRRPHAKESAPPRQHFQRRDYQRPPAWIGEQNRFSYLPEKKPGPPPVTRLLGEKYHSAAHLKSSAAGKYPVYLQLVGLKVDKPFLCEDETALAHYVRHTNWDVAHVVMRTIPKPPPFRPGGYR